MAAILGAASTATKFFLEVNHVSIDNMTFKLFYKATPALLLACSVIATRKEFFGSPIDCDVRDGGVNEKVLNTYCWMYSTFDISPDFQGQCIKREPDGSNLYNTYYQWVAIYLVCQAVIFYIPRTVWLSMEGGLMKFLSKGARGKIIQDPKEKQEHLLRTFQEHLHNRYNMYAFGFFSCELGNLIVVISQIFATNKFLNYTFLDYGYKVWNYYGLPPEERSLFSINPMCETFPRLASCTYVRYGSGGHEERKNAICVLGLNMINDKIFLVIWWWYFILLANSLFRFIYRVCQLLSAKLRYFMMKVKMHRYFKTNPNIHHIQHYILHCSIGDWFVLYQMSRNMNRRFFAEFLTILSKRVNPHPDEECDEHPFVMQYPIPGDRKLNVVSPKQNHIQAGWVETQQSSGQNLDITCDIGNEDEEKEGSDKEKIIPGPGDVVGPWS